MEKVRFKNTIDGGNGNWDGLTLPVTAPTFSFNNGWWQATLPARVGRLPANLYGKAPAGDPYLLIATMWTDRTAVTDDVVAVDTDAPVQRRDSWVAFAGNTHVSLVRPTDTISFAQETTGDAWLEFLIEPLAGTNEFGEVMLDYAREASRQRSVLEVETDLIVDANFNVPNWAGTLRIISLAAAGIIITLPDSSKQRLRDKLIVHRNGAGNVQIATQAGQFINSLPAVTLATNNRSTIVCGAGANYSATSVA